MVVGTDAVVHTCYIEKLFWKSHKIRKKTQGIEQFLKMNKYSITGISCG